MSDGKKGVSVTVIKADDDTVAKPVIKAEHSIQIDEDEKRYANDWPEPELPLDGLEEIVKNSSVLPQCCRAYRSNIAGYGIGIRYLHALGPVNDHHGGVGGHQGAVGVLGEVLVAGGVQNVDAEALILKLLSGM